MGVFEVAGRPGGNTTHGGQSGRTSKGPWSSRLVFSRPTTQSFIRRTAIACIELSLMFQSRQQQPLLRCVHGLRFPRKVSLHPHSLLNKHPPTFGEDHYQSSVAGGGCLWNSYCLFWGLEMFLMRMDLFLYR